MKNRIIKAGDCIVNGMEMALLVSTLRVRGREQVKVRDNLALGYLYQGFRNAWRQVDREVIRAAESVAVCYSEESMNAYLKSANIGGID